MDFGEFGPEISVIQLSFLQYNLYVFVIDIIDRLLRDLCLLKID